MRVTALLSLAASVAFAATASAAEIAAEPFDGGTLITIKGEIRSGDEQRFRELALEHDSAVVAMDSDGGSLLSAIEIGKIIRLRGFTTLVPADSVCTSACALIWVAGDERLLSAGGKIGFHASYRTTNGRVEETGLGNALVGRYLTLLNLPERAIVFATAAPPDSVLWLTAENKADSGIEFDEFADRSSVAVAQTVPASAGKLKAQVEGMQSVGTAGRNRFFVDLASVARSGPYRQVWSAIEAGANGSAAWRLARNQWLYNCPANTAALKAFVQYGADGEQVLAHEFDPAELRFEPVEAGSVGEAQLKLVCA